MDSNVIKKMSDIIKAEEECCVGIIRPDGFPHVSTRSILKADGVLHIYFSTGTDCNLANVLRQNNKASICIRKDSTNITMMGSVEFVNDMDMKAEVWQDWLIHHYTGGIEDPNYTLMKFTAKEYSVWMDQKMYYFSAEDFKTVVSRCGLLCNTCQFKEQMGCKGCIATDGYPFWGECRIAKCCGEKGKTHCGECAEMPCAPLHEFSHGDSEHSDSPKGARLEMLRVWKAQ